MNRSMIFVLSAASLALLACPRTVAQGVTYHYRYGDSRIIIQSEIGLPPPSNTYIGPGTISKSAQGVPEFGAQPNADLPKVNAGGFIGTPGDNLYGGSPIRSIDPPRLQARKPPVQIIYVQPQQVPDKPKEYTYVPGQNAPAQYASGESAPNVQLDPSGAATYGSGLGERHF